MKWKFIWRNIAFATFVILFSSCEKEDHSPVSCLNDAVTVRVIINQQATIKLIQGKFYIIENGTVDTKLIPCNLEKEYQLHNMPVTISGEVKATTGVASGACCTENIVILKITG